MAAQRHYLLDRSSIRFPEQLDELLHDRQWVEAMGSLPEGELQGPITYLDNVRSALTRTEFPLITFRFSMALIPRVHNSGTTYMYCREFAGRGRFSPQVTKWLAEFHAQPPWSRLVHLVMFIMAPLALRMSASNGSG